MTVTRALTNPSAVKEETRERVLEACIELGYTPDLVARALVTRKSFVLGVVVPRSSHNYWQRLALSITSGADRYGYHILIAQSQGSPLTLDEIMSFTGRYVDGLFIAGPECSREIYEYLQSRRLPTVFIEHPGPDRDSIFVNGDERLGAYIGVSHLLSLGHRRIAHIAGDHVRPASQRTLGYNAALLGHNIDPSEEDIYYSSYEIDGGYQAAEAVIKSGKPYTAIFCANDYIAIGALRRLYENNIRVPDDMSIVGFAGDEISRYCIPSLTTLNQPAEDIGARAVEAMMLEIKGELTERTILIAPKLLVRDSTAPVPDTRK